MGRGSSEREGRGGGKKSGEKERKGRTVGRGDEEREGGGDAERNGERDKVWGRGR